MKTLRILLTLLATLALGGTAAADTAGTDTPHYDDIKAALVDAAAAVDVLAQDIDQAQDAAAVAQAFLKFGDAMKAFKAAMEDMQKKYPELATASEPPAELMDSITAMQTTFAKMKDILAKADPYINDPAVQDAMQKMRGGM